MAVTRRNSKTTKATSNTTGKQKTEPEQQSPALKQHAHHPKRGAKAAAVEIEAILFRQVMSGNAGVAGTLLNLNNKSKSTKSAAKKHRGLTLAQRLALEPPWQGDSTQNLPSWIAPKSDL